MKFLILSHSSELGGAEKSMIDVFDYWVKKFKVEPVFIIRIPIKEMEAEIKKRGWKYYTLHYTNWSQRNPSKRAEDKYRNARHNTKAVFDIEKIIQKEKPDLVMTNTIVSPWAAIAAHFQQKPHVWFVREFGDIDHQHVMQMGREKTLQDIDTLSNLLITNSQTLKDHIKQYTTINEIAPLYTPFDLELLDRKIKQKDINPFKSDDSLKLVITGRISQSKGQAEAAEAVGELNKAGMDTELCVIGKPAQDDDADELNAVITKYQLEDKVHLVGHQSNPLAIIKNSDIGIMASKREAFGRVTFEYMYAGKAVIGSNSGATPELIEDGKQGYLYKNGDVKNLTSKIQKFHTDKNLADKLGQAAKKKAIQMMSGEYSADSVFKKIIETVDKYKPVRPINFAHTWLEYIELSDQYIEESGQLSFTHIVYVKVRGLLKTLYIHIFRRGELGNE